MTIEIEKQGRRHYLRNLPYELRHVAKDAGCRWDGAERAWWTGKADTAAAVVEAVSKAKAQPQPEGEGIDPEAAVIQGRATYKGKTYYLLLDGVSRKTGRPYAKLAFRDGSRVFWAQIPPNVEVVKRYREPMSLASLQRFAEKAKRDKAEYGYVPRRGVDYCGYPCPVDGHVCTPDHPCHDCQ